MSLSVERHNCWLLVKEEWTWSPASAIQSVGGRVSGSLSPLWSQPGLRRSAQIIRGCGGRQPTTKGPVDKGWQKGRTCCHKTKHSVKQKSPDFHPSPLSPPDPCTVPLEIRTKYRAFCQRTVGPLFVCQADKMIDNMFNYLESLPQY